MSRFFNLQGINLTEQIRQLAPDESVILEITNTTEGTDKPMRCVSAIATNLGYKIEQTCLKAIESHKNSDKVIFLIRIVRKS